MEIRTEPLFDSAVTVFAGPCSAESAAQTLETARGVAAAGAQVYRAGLWKPRTKPGGFEGVGAAGLPWLRRVRQETGLPVATEIATGAHLRQVLHAGIDAVWLGARTTANPFAVQDIADTFAALPPERRNSLAVLVKNPVNPDIDLWIGAVERLYSAGVRRLGAIHRGFSAYGEKYYRNAPMWRIPIELKRRLPQLPLYCDPSHIAGRRELVAPLCRQAADMEFDGLFIESHCNPAEALSDSAQQITPEQLAQLLTGLTQRTPDCGTILEGLRREIDSLDTELLELLAKRMSIAREIGQLKRQRGMAVVQPDRYRALIERRLAECPRLELNADFVRGMLAAIHEESVRQQLEL